jgi:L-seryl-tRNA(Ser) seleniumtransferase
MVGFTQEPELSELASLAHASGVWLIDDIGSGALGPGRPPGVVDEPTVAHAIAAGADLVLFSGDKLLGGPQCGIVVGSQRAIGQIEADPLMRALRLDKLTLAALEATLCLAADAHAATERIPLWSMVATPVSRLEARAEALAKILRDELSLDARVVPAQSFTGGGSAPVQPIPTAAIAISPPLPAHLASEAALARALRQGDPPVVARVQNALVLFDLRTVPGDRDADLLDAIREVCHDRNTTVGSNQAANSE